MPSWAPRRDLQNIAQTGSAAREKDAASISVGEGSSLSPGRSATPPTSASRVTVGPPHSIASDSWFLSSAVVHVMWTSQRAHERS
eukprot:9488763-Pyramimonas_sp.AAC.1